MMRQMYRASSCTARGSGWAVVLAAAALSPTWGRQASAQTVTATEVVGTVASFTTQRGVAGARVRLVGSDFGATADLEGRFRITGAPPGVYGLEVRAIGFQPFVRADVVVSTGKPAQVNVRLVPQPVTLATIEATPSYFRGPTDVKIQARTLDAEEVRRSPGTQEDVLRTVSLLPGVGVTTGGRNDLVVRGGAPFENLFVVDGLEVPNINHFGSQGSTGGPLTIVNVAFVQEVVFSSGAFGVQYGDRTSSATNIALRDGIDDRFGGEVNLSATGFGAILEGPISRNGSFLFSARRSYLDLLFDAAGFNFVPAYWDFQFKATQRFGSHNSLSGLFIGAINRLSFNNDTDDDRYENSRIIAPEQNQYFTGLTWTHFTNRGVLTATVGRTFTSYRTTQDNFVSPPDPFLRSISKEGENSLRLDYSWQATRSLDLQIGNITKYASDLSYDVFLDGDLRLDQDLQPSPLVVDTAFAAWSNATYGEASYRFGSSVRATGGLRADYYAFLTGGVKLSPRVGLSVELGDRSAVSVNAGRYYQPPAFIWLIGDPANGDALRPFRSDQIVARFERVVRPDIQFALEGYAKRYVDFPARVYRPQAVLAPAGFEDATDDIPFGLEPLLSEGSGFGYGGEFLVQKKLSEIPVYGLLSIGVSRTSFTALDDINRVGSFDTRFIGNTLIGYRPNASWEFSTKFRVATGRPTTPYFGSGPYTGRLDFSRYNAGPRLPTFHALDIRVDRRWSFSRLQLVTYLDVQNIYGRNNVSAIRWDPRVGQVEAQSSLGVLPTIGINIEF